MLNQTPKNVMAYRTKGKQKGIHLHCLECFFSLHDEANNNLPAHSST